MFLRSYIKTGVLLVAGPTLDVASRFVWLLSVVAVLTACTSTRLPRQSYPQYSYETNVTRVGNQIHIQISNHLRAPLRVWIFHDNQILQNQVSPQNPVLLAGKTDKTIVISSANNSDRPFRFSSRLGNPDRPIHPIEVELPFPEGREYRILQGNNTNFTHSSDWSRYAVDFNLATNDTITAATDGYVVRVVEQYEFGGPEAFWQPYANYITVYEPQSGHFLYYVHLVKNGSLVKLGDTVTRGQPIGLSGNTGQSTVEHLHFSVKVPDNSEAGLRSVPILFSGGISGTGLSAGDVVGR